MDPNSCMSDYVRSIYLDEHLVILQKLGGVTSAVACNVCHGNK